MSVNMDKRERWLADIKQSVSLYDQWFMEFAPSVYERCRMETTEAVRSALNHTEYLTRLTPDLLRQHPEVLQVLRMMTAPPLARDRLIGLSKAEGNLVRVLEEQHRIPPQMLPEEADEGLKRICQIITRFLDRRTFPWLMERRNPSRGEYETAVATVAAHFCAALADPIIRNAQEERQLGKLSNWLAGRGYRPLRDDERTSLRDMKPGTYALRFNAIGRKPGRGEVKVPIDVVVAPHRMKGEEIPLLIEAKSAGDFTNTNKRKKEESDKLANLRRELGSAVPFILFLCGYFDQAYLDYEASNGIDWVWEHRIDDLAQFGV